MNNFTFAIFVIGGLISLVLTLKYLPDGILFILCLPLWPFFALYAGMSEGDWIPSVLFFGPLVLVVVVQSFARK